jgi:methionine synthase / methylenetetrahydrofolate reductase(NADPH)
MGTLLDMYGSGERPHEIQNVKHPELVARIHQEYIDAGAEIIETNTFSANRFRLSQFHLEDRLIEINRAGVEIARRVAGDRVYVAGSVGPTGKLLEPIGKIRLSAARDSFKEQIEVLLAAGIDLLILETFVSLHELDEAIDAAKELTSIPIVAQKAFAEDGSILSGSFPLEVVEHLLSKGVDVVGANCTVGPQRMFSIIRAMYKDGVILSAQPAAGIPTFQDGRSVYHTTPEYLATYARELLQSGVTLIGACCGSTPAHIKAMRKALDEMAESLPPGTVPPEVSSKTRTVVESGAPAPSDAEGNRSEFARNLGKKFLVTAELDVPRGLDMSSVMEGARYLHRAGVDAINITDGARARLRMNSIALSHLMQRDVGIEAMTHLTTRDRNMIGLQSELLGAHLLGVRNILCITGDPTNVGDYPQATSVHDIDSIGLIRAVKAMNKGLDLMGNSLEQRTSFLIACAANPMAEDMDREIARLSRKVEAGADVVFTQPIYEMRTLELLAKRAEQWHVPIILGILPLRSYRHAEFLHNEIPGMAIPENIRESLRSAGNKAPALGVQITKDFLRTAKHLVSGAYLMPPFKKYDVVPQILEALD